jgi:hypothetical protein
VAGGGGGLGAGAGVAGGGEQMAYLDCPAHSPIPGDEVEVGRLFLSDWEYTKGNLPD